MTNRERCRNEPTSGLWFVGGVVLLLLWWVTRLDTALTRAPDPGSPLTPCVGGLRLLPGVEPAQIAACVQAAAFPWFLALDCVLVVVYTWFFRECVRWSYRCLGVGRAGRQIIRRVGPPIVLAAAGADLGENLVLAIVRHWPGHPRLYATIHVLATAKWLLVGVLLAVAVVVLTTGVRRFLLPWTVPPGLPATFPAKERGTNGPTPYVLKDADQGLAAWYTTPDEPRPPPQVGYSVGLSGGGIRSAAFCSGVLQSLAPTKCWSLDRARYLATVSGGGYLGVSSQMIRRQLVDTAVPHIYGEDAPETAALASRHRYLGDDALQRVQVLFALAAGLVLNLVLVFGPLVLLGLVLAVVPGVNPPDRRSGPVWTVVVPAVVALVASAVLWQGASAETDASAPPVTPERTARWRRRLSGVLTLLGCGALIAAVPFGMRWLGVTFDLAVVGAACYAEANARSSVAVQAWARAFFSSAWISVAVFAVGGATAGAWGNPPTWTDLARDQRWQAFIAGAVCLLILAAALLDQTWWSPHPFYKARLAATFAVRRVGTALKDDVDVLDPDEFTYLDKWAAPTGRNGPELLVCATAHVDNTEIQPFGSRAVPFVFNYRYVGSPELGWWSTKDFRRCLGRRLAPDGTLQAATAISGAAIASGLGVQGRIPTAGTLMAMLNARLGVWLPNPRATGRSLEWPSDGPRAWWIRIRRLKWFWYEVAGLLPSTGRFVYVSDGGHLDNLGLLELLRRRSRVILIVDASADKSFTTRTLDGVRDIAENHLQVTITPRSSALNTRAKGRRAKVLRATQDCVETLDVTYPDLGDGKAELYGVIVYAKARFANTLAGDDAQAVATAVSKTWVRRCWPWSLRTLPTTITANQALTDPQFDNYVRLGRAVGRLAVERLDEAARQLAIVDIWLRATRADVAERVKLLHPDVVLRVGTGDATSILVRGAAAVAEQATRYPTTGVQSRFAMVNGAPGVISIIDECPTAVAFTVANEVILKIDIETDPARLEALGAYLPGSIRGTKSSFRTRTGCDSSELEN